MSWNNQQRAVALKALSSFADMQFRIVELATSEINACDYAAGLRGYGVIQNEPRANEHATVVVEGETQCRAGVAVSIGDRITTATSAAGGPGWATAVVSGQAATGMTVLGIARSAASSGGVFTLELRPQRIYGVSSAGLLTT